MALRLASAARLCSHAAQLLPAAQQLHDTNALLGFSNNRGGQASSFSSAAVAERVQPRSRAQPRLSYGMAAADVAAPPPQEAPTESERFKVRVVTGTGRNAGSSLPAKIRLVGLHGTSDLLTIADSEENGFDRGSVKEFEVVVPHRIGPLKRVLVARSPGHVGSLGQGWFLQHVEVESLSDGRSYVFPCNGWLGKSDCGTVDGACGARESQTACTQSRSLLPPPRRCVPSAHDCHRCSADNHHHYHGLS